RDALMSTQYAPPLVVNFVWNFADAGVATPIIDVVRKSFARDKDKPFSRGLNIPIFYFSGQNSNEVPRNSPCAIAKKNIIFAFTSKNTTGRQSWKTYIEGLPHSPNTCIVPIAIDKHGLGHTGSLANLNCIRAYDWPADNQDYHAVVFLAHEIYRYGCLSINPDDPGKDSSITVFLSHAKAGDTGRLHAEEIRKFIDNTNMNRFFDSTEISPGFPFDQEIEKKVKQSTLVAIESDAYSSRYWCQREILCAKQHNRPIIVVNSLNDYEDRIFPAASNVPCVHVSSDSPISQRDILRILSAAILETVRHSHSMQCLEFYKEIGWIESDCDLSARPPEIRQALKMIKSGNQKKICYPEPPIYSDEADWHEHVCIEAFTPLWNASEKDCLAQQRIGISISEVHGDGFSSNHLHSDLLIRLAQDLARHLLARSATLIYGGDLRPDGFTEFILEEATILKERIRGNLQTIENHLAWPLYVSAPEIVSWRARYCQIMKTVEHDIPTDVAAGVSREVVLTPNTPENSYIWSRCLTEMRAKSIALSSVRICAGGKLSGYKGKMPGVLEEIVLSLDTQKPTFLLGAFGGVVGDVCSVLRGNDLPESLTEEWQILHNAGYSDVQAAAKIHGHECVYSAISDMLQRQKISDMASRCGLSEDEYIRLMRSPFADECLHLILKGINNLTTGDGWSAPTHIQ
ncbi:MAG: TIR domain-containing protein, partial [Moraxellaceae bacterium]|nr:TIR domain-containing protein [Moraxellaceae bacterium]